MAVSPQSSKIVSEKKESGQLLGLSPEVIPVTTPIIQSKVKLLPRVALAKAPTLQFSASQEQRSHNIIIRVLYVFAGEERRADVGEFLRASSLITAKIIEIDILRDPEKGDVTNAAVWKQILSDLSQGIYDVLLLGITTTLKGGMQACLNILI